MDLRYREWAKDRGESVQREYTVIVSSYYQLYYFDYL